MEHIKIFNSVTEKDNFIDADSFKYDIVGLIKNVEGVVYNPPEEVINSYVVSNVKYKDEVPFSSTANTVTWDYDIDKITRSGKHAAYTGSSSEVVEYDMNLTTSNKTISGEITVNGATIPYSFTQDTGNGSYLTFVALEDGTFTFTGSTTANTISYSLDGGTTWSTPAKNVTTPTVSSGNKVMWKAEMSYAGGFVGVGSFSSTCKFDAIGNIMSLLYGDNFLGKTSIKDDYQFIDLFSGSSVVNTNGLVLPATTLKTSCYQYMFENCRQLETSILELPATTAGYRPYLGMFRFCDKLRTAPIIKASSFGEQACMGMFNGCSSLTNVPSNMLSGTSIGSECFEDMFRGCVSLTKAPDLPATVYGGVGKINYNRMFNGCTSLNYVKCMILTPNTNYHEKWLEGVSSSGTFVKNPNATWERGINGIPDSWTVIDAS